MKVVKGKIKQIIGLLPIALYLLDAVSSVCVWLSCLVRLFFATSAVTNLLYLLYILFTVGSSGFFMKCGCP